MRPVGRRIRGRHAADLAPDHYGATAHRLEPWLLSLARSLHYQHGVPVRRVPAILAELTGVRATRSALTQDALRQAAGPVGDAYQTLRTDMGQAERSLRRPAVIARKVSQCSKNPLGADAHVRPSPVCSARPCSKAAPGPSSCLHLRRSLPAPSR